MTRRRKKRRKKRFRLIHLILLVLCLYVFSTIINQRKLMKTMEHKRASLQSDIKALEKEIDELNKEIENSDSLEFIEKVAREEMGMVKPREIIYIDKNKFKNSILNFFRK